MNGTARSRHHACSPRWQVSSFSISEIPFHFLLTFTVIILICWAVGCWGSSCSLGGSALSVAGSRGSAQTCLAAVASRAGVCCGTLGRSLQLASVSFLLLLSPKCTKVTLFPLFPKGPVLFPTCETSPPLAALSPRASSPWLCVDCSEAHAVASYLIYGSSSSIP